MNTTDSAPEGMSEEAQRGWADASALAPDGEHILALRRGIETLMPRERRSDYWAGVAERLDAEMREGGDRDLP